jgi:exosortase/archaeosortase family protein
MSPSRRAPRLGAGGLFVALGILVLAFNGRIRAVETRLSAHLAAVVTGTRTAAVPGTHTFYWLVGTLHMIGLLITSDCTSAILIGPLLFVAGFLSLGGRVPLSRLVPGAALAAAVLFAVNLLRLAAITWATYHFGMAGFTWSHTLLGSVLTLAALVGALVVLGSMAGRYRKPSPILE